MLVKDKQGHVFGGYASEPWLKNGKYYGEILVVYLVSQHQLTAPLGMQRDVIM